MVSETCCLNSAAMQQKCFGSFSMKHLLETGIAAYVNMHKDMSVSKFIMMGKRVSLNLISTVPRWPQTLS